MTFETSDTMRIGGFYGICNRGFAQWHAGRQAKGMTPWYWSAGKDGDGWLLCIHVPGFAFNAYWE